MNSFLLVAAGLLSAVLLLAVGGSSLANPIHMPAEGDLQGCLDQLEQKIGQIVVPLDVFQCSEEFRSANKHPADAPLTQLYALPESKLAIPSGHKTVALKETCDKFMHQVKSAVLSTTCGLDLAHVLAPGTAEYAAAGRPIIDDLLGLVGVCIFVGEPEWSQ